MSIYNKTIEEICELLVKKYKISEQMKTRIKDELIDGEVLYELNDQDFKDLRLRDYVIKGIKYIIANEKAKNGNDITTEDKLIKKLIKFGINDPQNKINSDFENSNLKIGQKKLLKKYEDIINSSLINRDSNETEILKIFKDNLKLSEETIKYFEDISGQYLFEVDEKEIESLDIIDEDKKKIINLIKSLTKKNDTKEKIEKKKFVKEPSELEKKMKFEEMTIYKFKDNEITMGTLYEKMKIKKEEIIKLHKDKKINEFNCYNLMLKNEICAKIYNIESNTFFDFSIGNISEKLILINPIKAKIKINDSLTDIDIISKCQLDFIIKENKFIKPKIECKVCKNTNFLNLFNLMKHLKCINVIIYESYIFTIFETEEKFKAFFPKKDKIDFSDPIDFEPNFNKYFNMNNKIKTTKPFTYYNNLEERNQICAHIKNCEYFGEYHIFFGFPGIGKSITILHILKYEIDHEKIKTLYIHCKHLSLLNKVYKYIEIQNILLSEIPFLFYNDFSAYKECANLIIDFNFSFGKGYMDLIEEIINFLLTKNCKYIIIFDQYNQSVDPKGKLNNIVEKILENENYANNFYFCSFMSLNNKDVKQLKIVQILDINTQNINPKIFEVKRIIYEANFENLKNEKENIYMKLGRTIKNFIELKDINDKKRLNLYYKNKKEMIKKKIIKYYNKNDNEMKISLEGIEDMMKFSIDTPYTTDEFESIVEYINFKYFDVQKNEELFKIIFYYPAIEEVMKEIYYSYIYNNKNFY